MSIENALLLAVVGLLSLFLVYQRVLIVRAKGRLHSRQSLTERLLRNEHDLELANAALREKVRVELTQLRDAIDDAAAFLNIDIRNEDP